MTPWARAAWGWGTRLVPGLMLTLVVFAVPASAETWKNVMLLDTMCSKKPHVMRRPTEHPRACILECHEDGFGVVLENGDFLPFDAVGNKLALEILRADGAPENNVRVTVVGKRDDGKIRVTKLRTVE